MSQIAPIPYAPTPKLPDTVCIHVNPLVRSTPSGVTSAMIERVGLKPTFMAKSSDRTTIRAIPSRLSNPMAVEMTSMLGSASRVSAAIVPPTRMNGRRRPRQNHTRSLQTPMMTWPNMPAIGPAAQTRPMSWISRPYCVVRIQLSAEICTDSAKPSAVAGSARIARNLLLRFLCIVSMLVIPCCYSCRAGMSVGCGRGRSTRSHCAPRPRTCVSATAGPAHTRAGA